MQINIKMTENSSNSDIVRKIKTQKDEEENFYIVEELDEEENPLELDDTEYADNDLSMEASNDQENKSNDDNKEIHSSSNNDRSMTIVRRTWDYAETKEMLTVFIENKRYIDRLIKVKDRYEFIAKKLNDRNPDQPINANCIENKVKGLIRTYRTNRGRKYVPKTDFDRDLEKIYGISRLLKRDDIKSEVFQNCSEKSTSYDSNDNYFDDVISTNINDTSITAGPSLSKKMKILRNSDSQTPRIRRQTQGTQTDLGDNMLMQLIQIDKNQQKRWEEEKALTARIERAKADRFARKESLLQELVNVLKSKLQ